MPNPNTQYVTEAMFLATAGRLERKVDHLSETVAAIIPRLAVADSEDAAEDSKKTRVSERRWAAAMVLFAAFASSALGALTTLALSH